MEIVCLADMACSFEFWLIDELHSNDGYPHSAEFVLHFVRCNMVTVTKPDCYHYYYIVKLNIFLFVWILTDIKHWHFVYSVIMFASQNNRWTWRKAANLPLWWGKAQFHSIMFKSYNIDSPSSFFCRFVNHPHRNEQQTWWLQTWGIGEEVKMQRYSFSCNWNQCCGQSQAGL